MENEGFIYPRVCYKSFACFLLDKSAVLFALVIGTVILTWAHSQPGPCSKGQLIVAVWQCTVGGCFTRTLTWAGLAWLGHLPPVPALPVSLKSILLWQDGKLMPIGSNSSPFSVMAPWPFPWASLELARPSWRRTPILGSTNEGEGGEETWKSVEKSQRLIRKWILREKFIAPAIDGKPRAGLNDGI